MSAFRDDVAAALARRDVLRDALADAAVLAARKRSEARDAELALSVIERELAEIEERLPKLEVVRRRRLIDHSARGLSTIQIAVALCIAAAVGVAIATVAG